MAEDTGYSMAMPFVVVESAGGPHPDGAFVAGYECGMIDATLSAMALADEGYRGSFIRYVRTESVAQLDLIAMRHGFLMHAEAYDEEWTYAQFYESEMP